MAIVISLAIIPTYNLKTIGLVDTTTGYVFPLADDPILQIDIPGFPTVYKSFDVGEVNIFDSTFLEITTTGEECDLPDGLYCFTYQMTGYDDVSISIFRVDALQQKFDEAFMQLDMMECDRAIKTQSKVDLMTIYFFIQGAIAAANNCAAIEAVKLYEKANSMLDAFINNNCNCNGNNYVINFQ